MARAWSRKSLIIRFTERIIIKAALINTAFQNTSASLSCIALYALLFKNVLSTYSRISVSSRTIISSDTASVCSAPRLPMHGFNICQNSRPKRLRPMRNTAHTAIETTPSRVCSSHNGVALNSACHFWMAAAGWIRPPMAGISSARRADSMFMGKREAV